MDDMCVCVCVFVSLDIHMYTHIHIYAYVGSKEGGNIHPLYISSTTVHLKVDEYHTCQQGWERKGKGLRLEV